MLIILLLHSLCFKLIYTSPTSTSTTYGQQRCMKPVPIQIPECQNTFYNYTGMPNLIGQETQFDARHQLQTFKPLITYKCSSKLNFFLCSIYTPMCDVNTHYLIGPCRPLCEHVRARCAPVLRVFDFNWPENLNCSQFPLKNSVGGAMCMEGPEDLEEDINPSKSAISSSSSSDSNSNNNLELKDKINKPNHKDLPLDSSVKQMLQVITLDNEKTPNNEMKQQVPIKGTKDNDDDNDKEQLELNQIMEKLTGEFLTTKSFLPNTLITSHFNKYPLSLPQLAQSIRYCSHLKKSIFYIYINRTGRCAPLCDSNILYTTEAKQLSIMWTSILACICSLITIYTLIRYIMNLSHFRFNEKPIIYIALCQLFYALGFCLSLILGRTNITCGQDLDSGQRIRLQEGLDNGLCVFIFIIQYFFSIASYIWWTMLVIHWSLQRISMITSYISSYCCNTHSPQLRNTCSHHNKQFNNADEINTESNCYCLPINSFCFCTENSFNWNQSEIIMNERLMQPSTKKHQTTNNNNNPNNPILNTTPTNVQQQQQQQQYQPNFQNTLNHTITNGIKRDNSSWSTTINHHNHNHDYCQQQQQQQKYSMVFTSKSDQVSACLAREHVVAWLTAGLFTVGVLVSRQVDADELIPVCGVGRQNTNVLGAFILGPQTVLITLGSIAFTIGFLCLLPCFRKCKCFYWSQCNTNGNQSSRHHSVQSKRQNYNQGIDNQLIDGNPTFTGSMVNRSHHHHYHRHHHYQPTSHNIHQPHHHAHNHQSLRNHSSQRFNQNYPQHLCYTTSMSSSSSSSCDPMEFRIGLFCFLYLIPLICMNACDLYEYLYRDKWLTVPGYKQHMDDHSTNVNTNNHSNNNNNNNHKLINNQYPNIYGTRNHPEIMNFASYLWNINEVYGPNPELFMLRIFMSLVTGFTCSLWMWTVKGCCRCSYFNYNCCLSVTNNIETLKQKQWENQNLPRNSKPFELTKQNYLCSNEFIKNNDNNGNKHNYKSKFTRTPDGTTYTLHPYAIYQHTKTPDNYHSQQLGINGQFDHRFPTIGCYSSTSLTNTTTNLDKNPSNIPSLLTKGHLSQLDTNFVGRDLEHSTSTTPGYYSHAKISPNMIIDSMSENASASSIPPPLPPSNNRPSRLPARGDPCVGASSSQVFGLNNKMNTDNLDNHITNSTMNNNNTDNSETENYSLIQFQITS